MSTPASPTRRPPRSTPVSDHWRANPFHRMRLGDAAPDRVEFYGDDPRAGDAERGREIERGIWRFGAERLSAPSPWRAQHPSRHFTVRLHSFAWLADLAAAHAHARMAQLTDGWVEEFGEWDELAWDVELAAERLFAWLTWGRSAFEVGAPDKRIGLLRSAARHARLLLLAQNDLNDRHLASIKAGAALVLAGAAGFPEARRLAEQGEEMLLEACAKQFHGDGGHLSRSPEALADALGDLVTALDAMEEPPQLIRDTMPKLGNMLRMLRLGDGGLGCFHGGSEASPAAIDAILARVEGPVRAFQFANHTAFQRLESGAMRVLFDVGGAPPPSYAERAHASALAFELSDGAERVIVNIGTARDLEPEARQAARATNAHSTLVLDDALSATLEDPRRGKGAGRLIGPALDEVRRAADESGVTVQGRHDGYRAAYGLLHRRYLFIDNDGKNLRGIDELARPTKMKGAPRKTEAPYVVRFHLHPEVSAKLIEHQMALLETAGGQRWRLRTDAPNIAVEPSIYWGGKAPRESLQITLSGLADPMGHGLAPPNRIRWALARA